MKNTSFLGDIAVTKVIADLTQSKYDVLLPISEHLRYDLVIHKDGLFKKIQVKYSSGIKNNHLLRAHSHRQSAGISYLNKYQDGDFDYYAIYMADIDKICYPSIELAGHYIRSKLPKDRNLGFYWYEDFTLFSQPNKRHLSDFGVILPKKVRLHCRRKRPDIEYLKQMAWTKPNTELCKEFGVSDRTLGKWYKEFNIEKPPRGYWSRFR